MLALAVAIAVAGAFTRTVTDRFDAPLLPRSDGFDVFGVVALLALLGMLLVRRAFYNGEPQKAWYDERAVAESVKSLAWRYAVGGAPFFCDAHPQARPTAETDSLFMDRISEVVEQFDANAAPSALDRSQITGRMLRVRAASLSERRREYALLLVADQKSCYTSKARRNATRAQQWRRASVGLEAAGFVAAVVKAGGWYSDVDLLGIVATILAAVVAWTNAKQHTTLAESYTIAARDLADVERGLERQNSEEGWAEFVANAEAAMSREHTVWRARRSVPTAA